MQYQSVPFMTHSCLQVKNDPVPRLSIMNGLGLTTKLRKALARVNVHQYRGHRVHGRLGRREDNLGRPVQKLLEDMRVRACIVLLPVAYTSPRQAFSAHMLVRRATSEGSATTGDPTECNNWSDPIACSHFEVVPWSAHGNCIRVIKTVGPH